MRKISVCVTPNLLPLYKSNNQIVVVVDVLRATSSITAGMASGIAKILPVATVEECRTLQAAGYIAAGERDGKMVEGFTLGNSPFDYMDEKLKGQTIAMTTTNGTLAIHLSEGAKEIVIGSFLNLSSVANYLASQDADILVVCAGWKGKFNLEDTMFAGALVEKLQGQIDVDCDAAVSALYLYQAAQVDLMLFMEKSSHYRRLKHLDVIDDIAFCLSVDHFDCVPVVQNGKEIILKKMV